MNVVLLIGNVTRDPELRYVAAGHAMAQFTLAVDRDLANGDGERETDFVSVVCRRKLAEQVGEYATRGRLVGVQGRLQMRSYEASDGSRRRITEIVAGAVRSLDKPRDAAKPETPAEQSEKAAPGKAVPS